MIDPIAAAAFVALEAHANGDLLVVADDELRIVRAGRAAADLADRREADLPGMSLIAAFGSAALDGIARTAVSDRVATTGEASLGHLGARWFATDAVPLADGGVVLVLHDVTSLRRLERVRRDFIANVGHELRTPLTSIKLLAETLTSGAVDDADTRREFAVQIEREVDHLAQLVNELLDLSRIESGETALALAPVDPAAVVRSCVERMEPIAARRGISVRQLASAESDARAMVDADRIGQALLNLAHNAVKYSHPGGEVRIGWEPMNDRIRFSVADDGIGIPDAHQARIFERFYKVDRARGREPDEPGGSAGLGLAIVRHIAEAHGGAAGVSSDEGSGSTFWLDVPRAEERAADG